MYYGKNTASTVLLGLIRRVWVCLFAVVGGMLGKSDKPTIIILAGCVHTLLMLAAFVGCCSIQGQSRVKTVEGLLRLS